MEITLLIIILVLIISCFLVIVFSYLLFKLRICNLSGTLQKWLKSNCSCCYGDVKRSQRGVSTQSSLLNYKNANVSPLIELPDSAKIETDAGGKQTARNVHRSAMHFTRDAERLRLNAALLHTHCQVTIDVDGQGVAPTRPGLGSVDLRSANNSAENEREVVFSSSQRRFATWPRRQQVQVRSSPTVAKISNGDCVLLVPLRASESEFRRFSSSSAGNRITSHQRPVSRSAAQDGDGDGDAVRVDVTLQISESGDSNEDDDARRCTDLLVDVWQLRAQFESEEGDSRVSDRASVRNQNQNQNQNRHALSPELETHESRRQKYIHAFYTRHNAQTRAPALQRAAENSTSATSGSRPNSDSLASSERSASISLSAPVSFESADHHSSLSPGEFLEQVSKQLLSTAEGSFKASGRSAVPKAASNGLLADDALGSPAVRFSITGLARRRQFSTNGKLMLPVYETMDYGGTPKTDSTDRDFDRALPSGTASCISGSQSPNHSASTPVPLSVAIARMDCEEQISLACVDTKTRAIVAEFLRGEAGYLDESKRYRMRKKRSNGKKRTHSETERQTLLQPCRRYHAKAMLGASFGRRIDIQNRMQQMHRMQYHCSADAATSVPATEEIAESESASYARIFIRQQMHSFEGNHQFDAIELVSSPPALPCYSAPTICATASTAPLSDATFSDKRNYYMKSAHTRMLSDSMNSSCSTSFREIPVIRLTTDTEDTAQFE